MLEKEIEAYLVKRMKAIGGECYKFVSPARRGVPDRMCVFPDGKVVFAELKAPGKKPTKLQEVEMQKLRDLHQTVYVVDHTAQVDNMIYAHS